jgi:methionyl-tRNA formyltransferase
MRVVFWGTPGFALPPLRALSDEGHDVIAVVTQPDRPAGRGRKSSPSEVKAFAEAELIPVLQPEKAHDPEFIAQLNALDPDVSVVVAYGQILRPEVLDIPEFGSINIHGSLLPQLRGAAPVHWAIIQGLSVTGVTIMQMEAGLDSGPILHQVEEPIRADESMSELAGRLSEIGAEALIEALALMEMGEIHPKPQDNSRATYAPKLDRQAAHLDWSKPAIDVARWIRGLDGTPGAWSLLNGSEAIKVSSPRVEIRHGTPGEVLDIEPEVGMLVAAGHESVRIREVQPPGRRRMSAAEWMRGRGVAIGDRFT